MKKLLFSNMIYLFLLKGLQYLLPLITIPYLVSTLGLSNFGVLSFVAAFTQYFVLLTNYGFDISATRKISLNRDDHKKLSEIYSNIFFLKLVLLVISACLFITLILLVPAFNENTYIYLVTFTMVIGHALFPLWLFQGLEKMKYITIINGVTAIITTSAIFLFVKEPSDLLLASFLQSSVFLINGLISICIIRFSWKIKLVLPKVSVLFEEVKEGWHIFVSSLLSSILATSGVFFLGLFQSKEVVGIYSAIDKIVKAFVGLYSPITQAIFPQTSARFNKSFKEGMNFVKKTSAYLIPVALILSVLIAVFAQDILALLYEDEISQYAIILQIQAVWIFMAILNNMIGIQFLVCSGNSNLYSKSFTIVSIITLVLILTTTPYYSWMGLLLSVNIGEILLTVIMLFYAFRKTKIRSYV